MHVNVVGGGNIEGPSAGAAILLAMLSAAKNIKIMQDVAVTGEISIQGKVKEVGGIFEKIYGAKQAGIRKVLIPKGNCRPNRSLATTSAVASTGASHAENIRAGDPE